MVDWGLQGYQANFMKCRCFVVLQPNLLSYCVLTFLAKTNEIQNVACHRGKAKKKFLCGQYTTICYCSNVCAEMDKGLLTILVLVVFVTKSLNLGCNERRQNWKSGWLSYGNRLNPTNQNTIITSPSMLTHDCQLYVFGNLRRC